MGEGVGLFCAFIDYKKVFDPVNRSYLWRKLLNHTMFKIIHNLYANAKSCVRMGHFKSELFRSYIGVRQGENLLNLLHTYNGLEDVSDMSKLLLGNVENEVVFQAIHITATLNALYLYCNSWDLRKVNPSKTKITKYFAIENFSRTMCSL